jgi:hypothetical protein
LVSDSCRNADGLACYGETCPIVLNFEVSFYGGEVGITVILTGDLGFDRASLNFSSLRFFNAIFFLALDCAFEIILFSNMLN